jgi:hypothetical protein
MSSQPSNLEVTYSLTRGDIYLLNLRAVLTRPGLLLIHGGIIAVFTLVMLRDQKVAAESLSYRVTFGIAAALFLTSLMLGFQVVLVALLVSFKKLKGILGRHTLAIAEEGIVETTDFNQSLHRWPGIHRVRSTRRYLLIYINEVSFHAVPRRSFRTRDEASEFEAEVRRRSVGSK